MVNQSVGNVIQTADRPGAKLLPKDDLRVAIEAALHRGAFQPLPPTLEALYETKRGDARRNRLARALFWAGPLMLASVALDWLISPHLLGPGLILRATSGGVCLAAGATMRKARLPWQETALLMLPLLSMVLVTQILGELAPDRYAIRYMLAAVMLTAAFLTTLPLRLSTAAATAAGVGLLFPLLPVLLPQALLLSANWDLPVFVYGALGVSLLIASRNETARRNGFLYMLRDQLTAAEMNVLNAELLRLSTTDALTGLANRRQFESELERIWQDRRRPALGVALIDVDRFQSFHDNAGHVAGDNCLRAVADAVASALRRDCDRAARYGGEEFVVLLPGMAREEMAAMGERLRAAVAQLKIVHPGEQGTYLSISVGLGWCAEGERGIGPDALLHDADHALYEAKRDGRNRVVMGQSLRLAPWSEGAARA
jgi:diguanylate cyclase (GGDEF)-like protein